MENQKNVYFIAGVYGVGKSTLCDKLSRAMGIKAMSASDIISALNGETYGSEKSVKDKAANQYLLKKGVEQILERENCLILAGHFCIWDKNLNIEFLPDFIFNELSIAKIIMLNASSIQVIKNLHERDNQNYELDKIEDLMSAECNMAQRIADKYSIDLLIHNMSFSDNDVDQIMSFIKR